MMSDQDKQEYMDSLMNRMFAYMELNQLGSAEACLNNYESKLNIGWPRAKSMEI